MDTLRGTFDPDAIADRGWDASDDDGPESSQRRDLPPHAIHLLTNDCRQLGLAGRPGAIGFVREHGERRFQAVSQIAGLGERLGDAFVTVRQQRVEIVDQRLNLGWITACHLSFLPPMDRRQARAQHGEGR